VRALPVVVAGILTKNSFEVETAEDEQPIEALRLYRPYPAFRVGVRPWRPDGRLDHADAFRAEHLVEGDRELGVPVPDEELDGAPSFGEITDEVAGHLGDECAGRMVSNTEDVYFSRRQFDDEEHVELLQRHRVYGEEIRGEHAVRLGSQELPPRGSTPRDGTQTTSSPDSSDRAGRDPDAELAQLALDADASPAPVLPTQTDDELHYFIAHRRATRPSLPSPTSPLVLGCFAMPPQQSLWGDHERAPLASRKKPAQCSEDRSIGWSIANSCVQLPLENSHLVQEHHDLDIPLGLGPSARHNEAEDAAEAKVKGQEEHHRMMSESAANFQFKNPIGLLVSFSSADGLFWSKLCIIETHSGETVTCRPDEEHWHGATAEQFMEHLAMWEGDGTDRPETNWMEPVTDEPTGPALTTDNRAGSSAGYGRQCRRTGSPHEARDHQPLAKGGHPYGPLECRP
jgi:hypothetical protein